jgi:rhodanese-related sulfurtransferase
MLKALPELIAEARAHLRCLDAETAIGELKANHGTIVDVREPVEVSATPTPHSVNIPRGILEMKVTEAIPEADHPIYLHCASGGRATLAAEQLHKLGYTNVSVITCPTERTCAARTAVLYGPTVVPSSRTVTRPPSTTAMSVVVPPMSITNARSCPAKKRPPMALAAGPE